MENPYKPPEFDLENKSKRCIRQDINLAAYFGWFIGLIISFIGIIFDIPFIFIRFSHGELFYNTCIIGTLLINGITYSLGAVSFTLGILTWNWLVENEQ